MGLILIPREVSEDNSHSKRQEGFSDTGLDQTQIVLSVKLRHSLWYDAQDTAEPATGITCISDICLVLWVWVPIKQEE